MKRRSFLVLSGSSVFMTGSTNLFQDPALGLDFELSGIPNKNPEDIRSILVRFKEIEIDPQYFEKTEEANIKVILRIENTQAKEVEKKVQIKNQEILSKEDIGIKKIGISGLNLSQNKSSLRGEVEIKIESPSISKSYVNKFVITPNFVPEEAIHHWNVSAGEGNTVKDRIGNNDLSLESPKWVSDKATGGTTLEYNGSDDRSLGNKAPVTGSSNRTFVAWIKPNETGSGTGTQCIAEWGTDPDNSKRWNFEIRETGLRIEVEGDGYTSSLLPDADKWQLVGCRLDGNSLSDHTIYLDGKTESASGSQPVNTGNDNAIAFGEAHVRDFGRYFNGRIDESFITDTALSISKIDSYRNDTKDRYY
jgi:hypothetical protein